GPQPAEPTAPWQQHRPAPNRHTRQPGQPETPPYSANEPGNPTTPAGAPHPAHPHPHPTPPTAAYPPHPATATPPCSGTGDGCGHSTRSRPRWGHPGATRALSPTPQHQNRPGAEATKPLAEIQRP